MTASPGKFRALTQSLVQQAFQITGDLNEAIVYTSVSASPYNPVSGTTSDVTATYNFMGAVTKFGSTEADNKVVISTDAKLLCAYLDLPITPREDDTLTAQGITWKVVRVLGTPGQSLWVIHIRRI
jgi:hypothetical protein